LTRDPARRLGSGKADAEEIKKHPFFKDVSFDDVMNKRIPPPYFPTIVGLPSFYINIEITDKALYRTAAPIRATLTKNLRKNSQH
jgi:hypothetical protein